jgi:hypothetical protein
MHTKKQKRNLVKVNGRLVKRNLCLNKRVYTYFGSGGFYFQLCQVGGLVIIPKRNEPNLPKDQTW